MQTGQTALHKAAKKGKDDVVLALINAGTDTNAVDKVTSRFMFNIFKLLNMKVMSVLFFKRLVVSFSFLDQEGDTALYWAGNEKCKVLLKKEATM